MLHARMPSCSSSRSGSKGRCALRASVRCSLSSGDAELLRALRAAADDGVLPAAFAANRSRVTTSFLSSLADEAASLEELGSRLFALIERGEDGDSGEDAASASLVALASSDGGEAEVADLLAQRWAALAARGQAAAPLQRRLNADSRRDSAAALIGRAPAANALSALQPSADSRILDELLSCGEKELGAMLDEALTPASAGHFVDDLELLSTTPLRLLAAVEGSLGREADPAVVERLRELRARLSDIAFGPEQDL